MVAAGDDAKTANALSAFIPLDLADQFSLDEWTRMMQIDDCFYLAPIMRTSTAARRK